MSDVLLASMQMARGLAKPATPEDIKKEESYYFLANDDELFLLTDSGESVIPNTGDFGYTHPNLHRRIEDEVVLPPDADPDDYPFVHRDSDGNAYKQTVVLGVWDGINSYRTTTTWTHDEESTTSEIP